MIRKIVKKDITAISELIEKYLSSHPEYAPNSEKLISSLEECIQDEFSNLFVIVNDEDKALGYINFHILNFPLISGKELYVSELFINEEERGKNLGSKLINFAIGRGRELGCQRLMLNNGMDSVAYKRNFYKNLGFSQRDTMANFVLKISE